MKTIIYEKIRPNAIAPTKATSDSNGYDLYATREMMLYPGDTVVIDTGLRFKLPPGMFFYVSSKSGLARKHNIMVLNSPALIDSGYRGELSVILHKMMTSSHINTMVRYEGMFDFYRVTEGEKIAQLVPFPDQEVEFIEGVVENDTERGEGGFGHTGKY